MIATNERLWFRRRLNGMAKDLDQIPELEALLALASDHNN